MKMLFWLIIYCAMLASSQLLLKIGLNKIGAFSIKSFSDLLTHSLLIIKSPFIVFGTIMMASSYFLWMTILSWFKLSIAFPMTALAFIFVAILSFLFLEEKLLWHNYFGVVLIAAGIFLLLFKQI